jgi:hypothetical protein
MKSQRKNESQINMLKEKLRVANPQPRHDALPTREQTIQPPVSRAASGSWRRPAFLSHRDPPGASQRPSSSGSSSSRISLLSPAQPTETQRYSNTPPSTPDFNNGSATTPEHYKSTYNAEAGAGPALAHTAGHVALSSTGKRKREIEVDSENRRPPEAVVVPPSSPSRLRQLAERGLRTLTPKRSPRKKLAQLAGASESAPYIPLTLAPPPFDIPNQRGVNAESSQVHLVPGKRPLRGSQEQAPIGGRNHPSKHRVRLHEMLATMTNIET